MIPADQPVSSVVLGTRWRASTGYYRAAAGDGPALNTTSMTRVIWFQHFREGVPAGQNRYLFNSHLIGGGWSFFYAGRTMSGALSAGGVITNLSLTTATSPLRLGLNVVLLSWDGVDLRLNMWGGVANSVPKAGAIGGAPGPLTVGVYNGAVASTLFQAQDVGIGGCIVENDFRLAPADETTYLDAVVDALQQGRSVPLPSGAAGGALKWRWDARDLFTSVGAPPPDKWNDQINGYTLARTGTPELACVAARF